MVVKKIIIYLAICSFVLLIGCGKEQTEQVALTNIENNLNLQHYARALGFFAHYINCMGINCCLEVG
ncbi:hypothetical protein LJR153_003452 [Paenibacillus sp. LjRoot153]|uniref:hypothetical protein n=1 Tax=Paenibacillus sp. LjRoot153 TaxID=3342270 RepID=UPI003ECDB252